MNLLSCKWRWNFALSLLWPSSKWQFKCYLLSCSNFIIWLGKMGDVIILGFLHHSLRHGGRDDSSAIRLYSPQPGRSSLSKGLFCFSFWPHSLCFPFTYCCVMICDDFDDRRTNISRKGLSAVLSFSSIARISWTMLLHFQGKQPFFCPGKSVISLFPHIIHFLVHVSKRFSKSFSCSTLFWFDKLRLADWRGSSLIPLGFDTPDNRWRAVSAQEGKATTTPASPLCSSSNFIHIYTHTNIYRNKILNMLFPQWISE